MSTAIEITSRLRACFGHFDHVKQMMNRLEELYAYTCDDEEPEHLLVIGESGVGKSTLLKRFCKRYPRIEHEEFVEIPVLYVVVQPGCTIKRLARSMLLEMGSKFWNKGDEEELRNQLVCLMSACKVRMVILDEVNHLVDRGRAQTHHNIADWIKGLADTVRVPFVLAGIPRAKRLLDANDQLRSRFREQIEIKRFSVGGDKALSQFRGALNAFSRLLGGLPTVCLTDDTVARSIHFATDGRLRDIRRLLVRTVKIAYNQQKPSITKSTLLQAFRQVIFKEATETRNPFSAKFNEMPLVNPGEPFSPREE